ncbi:MAG TPA: UDP-N-acetylmuramate dehydrogenase [Dehalococcoidia bacterium]|jgi:UDP-N-acetylmuramate dehydrogenase|nr:UDP-N-acetylmuramate dehydrogenase [Dehalococcoidia bacterium]
MVNVVANKSLTGYTYLRIGGAAEWFAEPNNIDELHDLIKWAHEKTLSVRIIGAGSNILIADGGVGGLVISLKIACSNIQVSGTNITTGSGVMLPALAKKAANSGLSGAEFCIGIPGTVGGALQSNSGTAANSDMSTIVSRVTVLKNGKFKNYSHNDIVWGYRETSLKSSGDIVIEARFNLVGKSSDAINSNMRALLASRKATQPTAEPNAGSIFKNPDGDYAGRLIEAAGCKELGTKNASVNKLHANFITHNGNAGSDEIVYLITEIQKKVQSSFGIRLNPEIEWWGSEVSPSCFDK